MSSETAGPFGRSERETIREHYRYIERREEAKRRLRIEALRLAVASRAVPGDDADDIANAARIFHEFLTGGDS